MDDFPQEIPYINGVSGDIIVIRMPSSARLSDLFGI